MQEEYRIVETIEFSISSQISPAYRNDEIRAYIVIHLSLEVLMSPATLMGPPFRHGHGTTSSPFVPADRDAGGPGTAVSTGGLLACPSWLGFGRPRRRLWLLPPDRQSG